MIGQRLNTRQGDDGERRWLSLLVDAMEEVSRPEIRALPIEAAILKALRAQLARPTPRFSYSPSAFSLRN